MTIKAKTQRIKQGEYRATIGDVTESGTSAVDAAQNAERTAMLALTWTVPVVECVPSAGLVLVAYQNAGRFCYDVFDATTNHHRVGVSTGDTYAECVAAMRRHAQQYAADAALSSAREANELVRRSEQDLQATR